MRLLAAALIVLVPSAARAWGQTGHRVVGAVADRYLSPSARGGLVATLGVEDLAEASNWADFQKSDPAAFWRDEANPWHYVTVPPGRTHAETGAPREGDAVTALARFTATVRDPRATLAERQLALRFIIHIVGDLHQPLHAGRPGDRGGNDVKLTFFGQPTNLHAVWDSGIVDREQLGFADKAAWLGRRITPEQLRAWDRPDPQVWITESTALRDRIYPAAEVTSLGYGYVWQWQAAVDQRLSQGGVRLASYLNWLFAPDIAAPPHRGRRGRIRRAPGTQAAPAPVAPTPPAA